jgi:glycosyltransferase involved in cell wall biosynthesis
MAKIAFVYSGGREGRGSDGPSDFFYGARELAGLGGGEIECLDLDARPADLGTAMIGGILGKWLPPRTSADWVARCRRVLPRLREADVVVATATEISLGLAVWKALGFFRKPLVGILCGAVNYPIGNELRRRGVARLLGKFRPVLFADAELAEMESRFELQADLISVGWFGVDETFWTFPERSGGREGVLAVGNDSRRDFLILVEVARFLPEISFTVITRREKPRFLPLNVEWRLGDWKEAPVTDEELRALYQKAACVVVPLEECIQPSGQSVAMQAIMCGAPVVHTHTNGWWGAEVLRDGVDVELVPPRDARAMARAIQKVVSCNQKNHARDRLLAHDWTASGFARRISRVVETAVEDWRRPT